MTMFRFQPAVSLDGPDQSEEDPLGVRGLEWLVGRQPPFLPDQL